MSKKHVPKIMSGKMAVVARRYALALYELAQDKKELPQVIADVKVLHEALDNSVNFLRMAAHPRLTRRQLVEAMEKASVQLKLSDLTAHFLVLVAHNRRLDCLDHIIDAFFFLDQKHRGEVTAEVVVPQSLTEGQSATLKASLASMMGRAIDIIEVEDASLLGGMTVQMGSRFIDASLKGKLARIERQLRLQQEAA